MGLTEWKSAIVQILALVRAEVIPWANSLIVNFYPFTFFRQAGFAVVWATGIYSPKRYNAHSLQDIACMDSKHAFIFLFCFAVNVFQ
jgi:hypothetical protein